MLDDAAVEAAWNMEGRVAGAHSVVPIFIVWGAVDVVWSVMALVGLDLYAADHTRLETSWDADADMWDPSTWMLASDESIGLVRDVISDCAGLDVTSMCSYWCN